MPKITATETIEEPPKLKSGKGKPVTGIIPTTVDMFINTVSYTHLTLPTKRIV